MFGWNFGGHCTDSACSLCYPDADVSDRQLGGSHAAGVAGGITNRVTGAAGVAPNAQIMALKVQHRLPPGVHACRAHTHGREGFGHTCHDGRLYRH
jgi:hypothetical protein